MIKVHIFHARSEYIIPEMLPVLSLQKNLLLTPLPAMPIQIVF